MTQKKPQHLTLSKSQQAMLPSAWFLTDDNRLHKPEDFIPSLPGDCGVILRDYGLEADIRQRRAETLAALCQQQKRPLLIAGDPDLAKSIGANGVHLSEKILYRFDLEQLPSDWIITSSCHGLASLSYLTHPRLSALLVSPVFPTKSHENAPTLGVSGLENIARQTTKPLYALGGVDRNNYKELSHIPNLKGYAAISDFLENE